MTNPLVSVVIPTYNRARSLTAAVESVRAQTYSQVEAIVIDDGSTDDTDALVSRLWRDEPRVRYFRTENAGVASARNVGLREARGGFVAFLDSDDTWFPWKLELQLACLRAFPQAGMVWSDMRAVGSDGRIESPRYLRTMYSAWRRFEARQIFDDSRPLLQIAPELRQFVGESIAYAGKMLSPMITGNLVHTSTVLLTRERFERVGEFDESLKPSGEDYDFHIRTCAEGSVAFADLPTIDYQCGMSDRLTGPQYEIHLARHFLVSVERAIAAHGHRIDLPAGVLEEVRAEAHRWIGTASISLGNHADARRHLATSLRHRAFQPRTAAFLCLALLPPSAARRLRQMVRRLRAIPGGGPHR